ncbi:MAG: hypothetical protein H0Z37_11660 [Firmicutes bacterium]|nr:hypothetical protein [Bacillota bacterium]
MNRGWIWGLAGILLGTALGFLLMQGQLGRAGAGNGQPSSDTGPADVSSEERELEALRLAVTGTEGRLVETQLTPDGWILDIEAEASGLELERLEETACKMFKEVARTGAQVASASLLFFTDQLKDVYGHPIKGVPVARIRLNGSVFTRINWDGFDPRNFYRVADEYWLHDRLKSQFNRRRESDEAQGGPQGGSEVGTIQSEGGAGQGGGGGHSSQGADA